MNRHTLSADSDRWWYPTAIAGAIGTVADGALLLVPVLGAQASQIQAPTHRPGPVTFIDRPCYLTPAGWHAPTSWHQPVCTTEIRRAGDGFTSGSHRVLPRYLP